MDIGQSPHFKYANQTLDWLPMDTQKRYQNNLQHSYQGLLANDWIDRTISYRFNSHGFRCAEFGSRPSMVFLGCSLTQGIGLPVEYTWATLVANHYGLACYNLGIAGASNDAAFRLARAWLEKIRPKAVVLCTPPSERLELLTQDQSIELLPNSPVTHPGQDFFKHWTLNPNNSVLNREKNILAVENLCSRLGMYLLVVDSKLLLTDMYLDLARDLSHPGIKSNRAFADHVINLVPREGFEPSTAPF